MTVYIDRRRIKAVALAVMTSKQFHQIARALADPQRFAILERIAGERGELACRALVQELPVSQATVSHHLKELTEAGLIGCRREAQCAFLSLKSEVMEAYRKELGRRMALRS
jgi:ArsR family transcriptional regulator, arsenate/arsenite/antimonite-responsive transcriptional repressor